MAGASNADMVDCGDGTLAEIARGRWGQVTMRTVLPGFEAGGHSHPNTEERWWVVAGDALITLRIGADAKVIRPDRDRLVKVPAGAWHSIRNVGRDTVVLLFWSDKVFEEQQRVG